MNRSMPPQLSKKNKIAGKKLEDWSSKEIDVFRQLACQEISEWKLFRKILQGELHRRSVEEGKKMAKDYVH